MAKQKIQRPLLYIQQPTFETSKAPMQQFFMTKKSKPLEDNTILEKIKEVVHPEVMAAAINEMEPNIMEFILEGILTQENEADNMEQSNEVSTATPHENQEEIQLEIETPDNMFSPENRSSLIENETVQRNRVPFNELNLENKLKKIKKMTAMVVKFKYEFIAEGQTIIGYLLLAEESVFTIQPVNTNKTIVLNEADIIDIKIVGI
jgi:hypothetical protein